MFSDHLSDKGVTSRTYRKSTSRQQTTHLSPKRAKWEPSTHSSGHSVQVPLPPSSVTHHQGDAGHNLCDPAPHTSQRPESETRSGAGEDAEKRAACPAYGDAKWCRCHGNQCGGSSKNETVTPRSHNSPPGCIITNTGRGVSGVGTSTFTAIAFMATGRCHPRVCRRRRG